MEGECETMITDSVNYYEKYADDFVASTINADVSKLYEEFENNLKPGCRIMDLGCGSGRDSRYFAGKGYEVVAVDPSLAMCVKTNEIAEVITYNLKAEELFFEDEFDAVWACASLLHVARPDQVSALRMICRSLRKNGILYCSWKYGHQDRSDRGRSFTDFDEGELYRTLAYVPKLKLIKSWVTMDARPDRQEQKWLNALLRKAAE